jgi:hypothetical protein
VHYNTIRQWEQSGLLRTTKRGGTRGALIDANDLRRILAERSSAGGASLGGGGDAEAIAALNRRVDALVTGLEALLASVRGVSGPRRRPGRPLGSKNKPKAGPRGGGRKGRAPKKRARRAPRSRAGAPKRARRAKARRR